MTDFGTITVSDTFINAVPVSNYKLGMIVNRYGALTGIFNYHVFVGIIKPTLGQLWPRQMWHYNDDLAAPPSTWGPVTIYRFESYGSYYPPITIGQLWPRGDYVANATF